jgi:hypothetical protein
MIIGLFNILKEHSWENFDVWELEKSWTF